MERHLDLRADPRVGLQTIVGTQFDIARSTEASLAGIHRRQALCEERLARST
jgi:hypothetical protein